MRIYHSLNSPFFQIIGLPRDISLFFKTVYLLSQFQSVQSLLNPSEKAVMKKFIDGYPKDLKDHIEGG
jgi:hypothetical protein